MSVRCFVAALVVACHVGGCSGVDAETTYGGLVLTLRASDGDAQATFGGTATIVASPGYGACLEAFYREHDEDAFTAKDGKAAVADWRDRLCDDEALEHPLDCEVVAIEQQIGDGPARLVVTYAVMGALDGRELLLGPVPDTDGADCPGGALPGLHVGADAVVGRDVDDVEIWTAQPVDENIAVVGQDLPVVVYAARLLPP